MLNIEILLKLTKTKKEIISSKNNFVSIVKNLIKLLVN